MGSREEGGVGCGAGGARRAVQCSRQVRPSRKQYQHNQSRDLDQIFFMDHLTPNSTSPVNDTRPWDI